MITMREIFKFKYARCLVPHTKETPRLSLTCYLSSERFCLCSSSWMLMFLVISFLPGVALGEFVFSVAIVKSLFNCYLLTESLRAHLQLQQ